MSNRPASLQSAPGACPRSFHRSEEHTSELQSHSDLVCRLLLEKKKTARTRVSGRPDDGEHLSADALDRHTDRAASINGRAARATTYSPACQTRPASSTRAAQLR